MQKINSLLFLFGLILTDFLEMFAISWSDCAHIEILTVIHKVTWQTIMSRYPLHLHKILGILDKDADLLVVVLVPLVHGLLPISALLTHLNAGLEGLDAGSAALGADLRAVEGLSNH